MGGSGCGRSCSAEFTVDEPGTYTVMMKLTAVRNDNGKTRQDLIKAVRRIRKDKLLSTGHSFDTIHSKGLLREAENANAAKSITDARKAAKTRKTEVMKAERSFNKESKRRHKLRLARIDEEMARKAAEKKASKRSAAASVGASRGASVGANSIRAGSATAGQMEQPDGAPLTPPAEEDPAASEWVDEEGEDADADAEADLGPIARVISKIEHSADPSVNGEAEDGGDGNREEPINGEGEVTDPLAEEETQANGVNGTNGNEGGRGGEAEDDEDDASDVSAVQDDDFEWDSEIDDPVDPIVLPRPSDEDEDELFKEDPWNAICVVGLRVYSEGEGTKISVLRQ